MNKICTKCGKEKALSEFSRDKRQKYGRRPECKACEWQRGEKSIKSMKNRIKTNKAYSKIVITITKEEVEAIPNRCYFCQQDIKEHMIIHRKDLDQGYTVENSRKAHKKCHARYHNMYRVRNNKGQFMPRKVQG